jgi:endonuclease/exonuclease/phosphatase family metal-dependent hydrolase
VQWVTLETPAGTLNLLNTHLALRAKERLAQAEEILGESWLCDPRCRPRTVLCGDFNATPGSPVVRALCEKLNDAGLSSVDARPRTFPAALPLIQLDYVFVSSGVRVSACEVPHTRLARVASDHLPVVVDLELDAATVTEDASCKS